VAESMPIDAGSGSPLRPAAAPERDRLYEIDLLRIIAAVAVMVYHYAFANYAGGLTGVEYEASSVVARYGYLGVDLFFVISGFVVLLSAFGRRPEQFVISRMVRLYPAYWVSVTFTAIVLALFAAGQFKVTPVQYAANLTMLNSLPNIENIDVVYWTLWAELRFYALVFVLTLIGITRARVLGVLWGWLAVSLLLDLEFLPGPVQNALVLALQPEWSHYFIAGMALCLVYRERRVSWQPVAILLVALAHAVPVAIAFGDDVGERYGTGINRIAVAAIVVSVFAIMTLVALRLTRKVARPWFVALGALTYPLYLIHDRVGVVLFNRFDSVVHRWVLLFGVAALMAAVAWAINRFVEKPFAPVFKRALNALVRRVGLGGRPAASTTSAPPTVPAQRDVDDARPGSRSREIEDASQDPENPSEMRTDVSRFPP
jgi:peptidoglycan/LPS O-acetylase OafA/YrhL